MKRFCGRDFSGREMRRLCELIGEDPTRSRAQLSRLACQLLGWFKPDGGLKEMSCRVAMLRMHRQGLLQLPPPRNPKGGSGQSSTLSAAHHNRCCSDPCTSCPACIWSRS